MAILPGTRLPRTSPITTAFSPLSVAGLGLWLDASVSSSITQSAGSISRWDDLSGNGLFMTGDLGTQPTTVAAAQNGLAIVRFSGLQNFYGTLGLGEITVFFTAKTTNTGGINKILQTDSDQFTTILNGLGGSTYNIRPGDTITYGDGAAGFSQYTFHFTNAYGDVVQDGAVKVTSAVASTIPATSVLYLGGQGGNRWTGDLGQLLIYSGNVTGSDQAAIQSYQKAMWATP